MKADWGRLEHPHEKGQKGPDEQDCEWDIGALR